MDPPYSRRHVLGLSGSILMVGTAGCTFGLNGRLGSDPGALSISIANEDSTFHTVTVAIEDPDTGGFDETVELDAGESELFSEAISYLDYDRDLQPNVTLEDGRTATHEFRLTPTVQRLVITITESDVTFQTVEE